mmetsp:Transcript_3384/g.5192  ORF Transcript_3384/g.5192 Transcript_3384/m.5192 type:complete len:123 (-) Transcript_3384:136-504(-)
MIRNTLSIPRKMTNVFGNRTTTLTPTTRSFSRTSLSNNNTNTTKTTTTTSSPKQSSSSVSSQLKTPFLFGVGLYLGLALFGKDTLDDDDDNDDNENHAKRREGSAYFQELRDLMKGGGSSRS